MSQKSRAYVRAYKKWKKKNALEILLSLVRDYVLLSLSMLVSTSGTAAISNRSSIGCAVIETDHIGRTPHSDTKLTDTPLKKCRGFFLHPWALPLSIARAAVAGRNVQKRSTGRARHIRSDVPHRTGYKPWLTRGNLSVRREERSSQTQENITQPLIMNISCYWIRVYHRDWWKSTLERVNLLIFNISDTGSTRGG